MGLLKIAAYAVGGLFAFDVLSKAFGGGSRDFNQAVAINAASGRGGFMTTYLDGVTNPFMPYTMTAAMRSGINPMAMGLYGGPMGGMFNPYMSNPYMAMGGAMAYPPMGFGMTPWGCI